MADENNNKKQDDICCESGGCCTPTSSGGGWKTIVFTVIITLAVGVAGYSLFLREPNPAASGCDPATCTSASCDTTTSSKTAISGIPQITIGGKSIDDVNDMDDWLAGVDLAILLFLYSEDQFSTDDFIILKQSTREFDKKAVKSRIQKVFYEDPLFRQAMERFGISRLPAVVLKTKSGSKSVSIDDLTIDAILNAYENISESAKSSGA
jgi:hypothetical protein